MSADFHPSTAKFATCGQGRCGGLIVIWRVLSLLEKREIANSSNKISELDDHNGCVNCVKWSPEGKLLASGGDDNLVMLWRPTKIKTLYLKDIQESWRRAHSLIGHEADVLDLRWSPNGEYLASCSIDSTVIVWNRDNFPHKQVLLKGHNGFVKGLAWDPIGEYLASQSDDNTLRIWSVADFKQSSNTKRNHVVSNAVAVIKRPFKQCTPTTQFLRFDWSPDGQFLICSHALNNGGPVAKIIERNSWSCSRDLVGHRMAVTCVKFSPTVYGSTEDTKIMCAVGSRDCTLSIWFFPYKRPLVVLHELFEYPIMDLTW